MEKSLNVSYFCDWKMESGGKARSLPQWMTANNDQTSYESVQKSKVQNQRKHQYIMSPDELKAVAKEVLADCKTKQKQN
jgi:hypothetical protein